MKKHHLPLVALLLCAAGASAADPTSLPEQMADALRVQAARAGQISIQAVAVSEDGAALAVLGLPDGATGTFRAGDGFEIRVDDVSVPLSVKSIDADGVSLDAPTLPGGRVLLRSAVPERILKQKSGTAAKPGDLRYLEVNGLPLLDTIRLVAAVTGKSAISSPAAGDTPVRVMLSNMPGEKAMEAICSSLGLWWRPDPATGVPTVLSAEEYQRDLVSFREERTETFTLLYPNVVEVASVLYGLYPDRVLLTLGQDDILDDEKNDLARRFERFKMIDDASSSSGLSGISAGSVNSGSSSGRTFDFENNRVGRAAFADTRLETFRGLSAADVRELENARTAGDEETVRKILEAHRDVAPSIFVTVSRRNNLVIVRTGDAQAMDEIRALIRRIDVPTPTVLLELKVMQFAVDDGFNSTFEYEFNYDTDHDGREYRTSGGFPGFAPLGQNARTDMFSFQVLSDHFNARMQLLETEGKVKTLATPTLMVANNEVSRLFIGEEVPITTGVSLDPVMSVTSSGVATVSGYTVEPETQMRAVGTTLIVTPSINADRTVTLHLLQEQSVVVPNGGSIPYGDAGSLQSFSVDTIQSRRVSGTFMTSDGMLSAIGGLITETESERESRIPFLGSIPLLGWLFRSTERVKERDELVILVRPHVISTPAEGERTSRDLLRSVGQNPDLKTVWGDSTEEWTEYLQDDDEGFRGGH